MRQPSPLSVYDFRYWFRFADEEAEFKIGDATIPGRLLVSVGEDPLSVYGVQFIPTEVPSDEHVSMKGEITSASYKLLVDGGGFHHPNDFEPTGRFELYVVEQKDLKVATSIASLSGALKNVSGLHGLDASRTATGRRRRPVVRFNLGKWKVAICAIKQDKKIEKYGGSEITHLFTAAREDGKLFSPQQARAFANDLNIVLGFILGTRPGPSELVGVNRNGKYIWKLLRTPRVDPWKYTRTWSPDLFRYIWPHAGAIYDHIQEPEKREWSIRALNFYIDSVRAESGFDYAAIIAQMGLELLGSVLLVERLHVDEKAFERLDFANVLRLILHEACVNTDLPSGLRSPAASFLEKSTHQDGPKLTTEVRNCLVHPSKSKRDKLTKLTHYRYDTYRLSLYYFELLLLYAVGYKGPFNDRIFGNGPMHVFKIVPWSTE